MEFLYLLWNGNPSIWAGLITLIVIELVGIVLVFIAIAEKLPPCSVTAHGLPGCCRNVNTPVPAGVNLTAGP